MVVIEPGGYNEAIKYAGWKDAMQEEFDIILKSQTWELVERPLVKKVIGVKWVYKTKLNRDGTVNCRDINHNHNFLL